MTTGSIAANPRKPRVTRSTGIKLRVMHDFIPPTTVESGASHNRHGFAHRVVNNKLGFCDYVAIGSDLTDTVARPPAGSAATGSARRDADERVGDVWVDWDGHAVRTVADGDRKGVSGIRRPKKEARMSNRGQNVRPERDNPPARVTADEIARIARQCGYTGPIDRRMRGLILDVIASQAQKASYTQK